VQGRFQPLAPTHVYHDGNDQVEVWDADDFDPWETLEWQTVRALRYRQHKPDGKLVEATWLTDFPSRQLSSLSLYHMAKSRWEIENQTFNDAKNRYIETAPVERTWLNPASSARAVTIET